jgi:hypothetical protein
LRTNNEQEYVAFGPGINILREKGVLNMIETNLPAIEIFQIQHDEFLFLGIENIIIGPIENSDMRTIWGNFFNSGGWENILS